MAADTRGRSVSGQRENGPETELVSLNRDEVANKNGIRVFY